MQEASTTPIQVASSPFDIADADIIMRSSDLIDFHLYKTILTTASPIISDLISLPVPKPGSDDEKNGVPIVCMAEDSRTLDLMLRICHPGTVNPPLHDIGDIKRVLHVSRKFELACARDIAAQRLGIAAEVHPERAFAIAWVFELSDAVQAAARSTLRALRPLTYYEEFAHISAAAVFKLQEYQRKCVDAAKAVAAHRTQWMQVTKLARLVQHGQRRKRCSKCASPQSTASGMLSELNGYGSVYLPAWFKAYGEAVESALERKPCGATVLEWTLVSSSINAAMECESCKDHVAEVIDVMQEYSRSLAIEVESSTLEVVVHVKLRSNEGCILECDLGSFHETKVRSVYELRAGACSHRS